jgi:hypothetical protein
MAWSLLLKVALSVLAAQATPDGAIGHILAFSAVGVDTSLVASLASGLILRFWVELRMRGS